MTTRKLIEMTPGQEIEHLLRDIGLNIDRLDKLVSGSEAYTRNVSEDYNHWADGLKQCLKKVYSVCARVNHCVDLHDPKLDKSFHFLREAFTNLQFAQKQVHVFEGRLADKLRHAIEDVNGLYEDVKHHHIYRSMMEDVSKMDAFCYSHEFMGHLYDGDEVKRRRRGGWLASGFAAFTMSPSNRVKAKEDFDIGDE